MDEQTEQITLVHIYKLLWQILEELKAMRQKPESRDQIDLTAVAYQVAEIIHRRSGKDAPDKQ